MLGKRPLSFFGPDCINPENWEDARSRIVAKQLDWDSKYEQLPWYKRMLCHLLGEVTESVNTSEGMPIDSMVAWCVKHKMAKKHENNKLF